jgi:hypothetical protein
MVYNTTKYAKLPFSNGKMTAHTKRFMGKGIGGVLLAGPGSAGAASSYMDMDDYIRTTGRNPYKGGSGKGLSSVSSKLSKLNIESPSVVGRRKNITM